MRPRQICLKVFLRNGLAFDHPLQRKLSLSSLLSLLCLTATPLLLAPTIARAVSEPDITHLAQSLPPLPDVEGSSLPSVNVSNPGAGTIAQRYMVYVNGNSPLLLDQVRLVQPDAFRQQYNGRSVIQAGLYNSEQNAREQVQRLANSGIGADITSVQRAVSSTYAFSSVPPPPNSSASSSGSVPIPVVAVPDNSVEFGQSPNNALPPPPNATAAAGSNARAGSSAYYVIVPSGHQTAPVLRNQIVDMGVSSNLVQTRTVPFGPHVAVGPFSNRGEANEWNQYLNGFGMDARVHFQR
ncbi:MAG: hypothetical protein AAFX95_21330 [Cyanobacteria bacterium J06639_16]